MFPDTERGILQEDGSSASTGCLPEFYPRSKPMKQRDIEHLEMLRRKAKEESGKFNCIAFLQITVFVGMMCAFTIIFYRMACFRMEIDDIYENLALLRQEIRVSEHDHQSNSEVPPIDGSGISFKWLNFGGPASRSRERTGKDCNCSATPANLGSANLKRRRRSVVQEQQGADVAQFSQGVRPEDLDHFAVHLLPQETGSDTMNEGEFFNWTTSRDPSVANQPELELIDNKYLFIPVAGHYFLYSQVTFSDSHRRTVGHRIMKWGQCGKGRSTILLAASLTQQHHESGDIRDIIRDQADSSYTGGVVYLSAGDHLGVGPELYATKSVNITRKEMNTFFGAFLISKDEKAPSAIEECQ